MKHTNFWVSVSAMAACVATVCVIVVPPDFALKGLAWVTLGLAAGALAVMVALRRSPRSMGQVLEDVDAEPQPAMARMSRTNVAPKGRDIL
jgi:hypothetical protein